MGSRDDSEGFSELRFAETAANGTIAPDPYLDTASASQNEAEKWQDVARQQQDIASLLQRAAMHQREVIGRITPDEHDSLGAEYRQFEEQLLRLTAGAFTLEAHALDSAEQATRKTRDILMSTTQVQLR